MDVVLVQSLEKVIKFNPKKITGIDISEVSNLKSKRKISKILVQK